MLIFIFSFIVWKYFTHQKSRLLQQWWISNRSIILYRSLTRLRRSSQFHTLRYALSLKRHCKYNLFLNFYKYIRLLKPEIFATIILQRWCVFDRLNFHRHIEVFWPHTSALLNATNSKTLKEVSTLNVGEILLQFPIDKKYHVGRFAFKYEVSSLVYNCKTVYIQSMWQ